MTKTCPDCGRGLESFGYDACSDDKSLRLNKGGEEKFVQETEPLPGYEYKWPEEYR